MRFNFPAQGRGREKNLRWCWLQRSGSVSPPRFTWAIRVRRRCRRRAVSPDDGSFDASARRRCGLIDSANLEQRLAAEHQEPDIGLGIRSGRIGDGGPSFFERGRVTDGRC